MSPSFGFAVIYVDSKPHVVIFLCDLGEGTIKINFPTMSKYLNCIFASKYVITCLCEPHSSLVWWWMSAYHIKKEARRLERKYWKYDTTDTRLAWWEQFYRQRKLFQRKLH